VSGSRAGQPRIEYPALRIVRFSGEALHAGIEAHTIEGVEVRIYDPGKTVADCFKYLLDENDPVALLAQQVFNFPDVKVLLLSATPYKMYSLAWELQDDHYQDFYNTSRFLLRGDEAALTKLREGVVGFRDAYLNAGAGGAANIDQAKTQIEGILRRIMVRTERLASTADRDGMLREEPLGQDSLTPRDFRAFRHFDRIAQHIDAGDQVEFWKSTSYPLNLMEGYKVKQQLKSALENEDAASLDPLLADAKDHLLRWRDLQKYARIDPDNARLRALLRESVETGNWKLLWMPYPTTAAGEPSRKLGKRGTPRAWCSPPGGWCRRRSRSWPVTRRKGGSWNATLETSATRS